MLRIVNFKNIEHANQFTVVGDLINGVVITTNGRMYISDDLQCPYDVSIQVTNEDSIKCSPFIFNTTTKTIELIRYRKDAQAILLKKALINTPLVHYRALKTYSIDNDNVILPNGKYVFKLTHGARSLAVFTVEVGKYNARSICQYIRTYIDEYGNGGLSINDPSKDEPKVKHKTIETAPLSYSEKIAVLKEKLALRDITINLGEERYDGEAVEMYNNQHLIAQEHINESFVEFRVLRSIKGTMVIMGREDLNNDHDTVSTYIPNKETYIDYIKSLGYTTSMATGDILDEIYKVISDPQFPGLFGSVDVWVDVINDEWGIFEYQPQYSALNVPDAVHTEFIKTSLREFIEVADEGSL